MPNWKSQRDCVQRSMLLWSPFNVGETDRETCRVKFVIVATPLSGSSANAARACLSALEPDLIILDEFQRFSSLLGSDQSEEGKEIADLGQQFLAYPGAKILLLSATPYKAYTLAHESGTDDHHKDFLRVAFFLLNDASRFEALNHCLKEFNEALFDSTAQGAARLMSAKKALESVLRGHIVRTERLGVTVDRDGMIEEMPVPACRLEARDLEAFKALDTLARRMEQPDILEYGNRHLMS